MAKKKPEVKPKAKPKLDPEPKKKDLTKEDPYFVQEDYEVSLYLWWRSCSCYGLYSSTSMHVCAGEFYTCSGITMLAGSVNFLFLNLCCHSVSVQV